VKGVELKAMLGWIRENIQDNEPVLLKFPRREAAKKVRNTEKRRRISFVTDELGYSRWNARREAWMQALDENPTLFAEALDRAMETFDVRGWLEEQKSQESLGDA